MIDNLKLWNSVCKTDPKFTKKVNFGRKYTAIDAQYQIQNATEVFGTYGKWGLKDIQYEQIAIKEVILLKLNAKFFYPDGEFEINNSDFLLNQKGVIDKDIFKKIETDTLTKCLSKLGFNADIFLGMYEDMNYVNSVGAEFTMISNEQRVQLSQLIQDTKTDLKKFNDSFIINSLGELPVSEFNKALALLNSKLNKMKKDAAKLS